MEVVWLNEQNLFPAFSGGRLAGFRNAVPGSRFALVGVVAGRHSGGGAALIAVDGKPPKPYRVGMQVESGLVLQSVGAREARLGAALGGASAHVLSMPVPPGGMAAQR